MRSLLFTEPVDFLIGNTYGKYLERDTGTPLIRIGFPIFDRHHHHRYPVWGYQGGMNVLVWILDKIFDEIDRNTNVAGEDRLQLRHHPLRTDNRFSRVCGRAAACRFMCPCIVRAGRREALFALWEATACGGNDEFAGQQDPGRLQRARLRQEPGQVGKGAQEGLHQAARSPARAAGGCAFDGAKIALQPITDVAHLVHGPIACEGNSWDNRGAKSSGSQLYRTGFTTDINETDVIFGGEKRLFKSIKEIIEKYDPPAVFVYQTCVPAMIGDDIDAVCKAASAEIRQAGHPGQSRRASSARRTSATSSPARRCSTTSSARKSRNTRRPTTSTSSANTISSGELWQVKPLLDELGIRILACISGDAQISARSPLRTAPRAAMMVCSKAMINVARKMEERYGIPFFEGSFYGIGDTSDSLREIARLLVERGAPAELMDAHRSRDRARRGAGLGAHRTLQAASHRQAACC